MFAFTEFYSHFHTEPNSLLSQHLLYVANKTSQIISETKFQDDIKLGYYTGLLHDIGKLNPFYQELFRGDKNDTGLEEQLLQKYQKVHSPYSAWLAQEMLKLSEQQLHDLMILIYKHHGTLTESLGDFVFKQTDVRGIIQKNFREFAMQNKNTPGFENINWDIEDIFFREPVQYEAELEKNTEHNFLRIGFLFSALLQADRGSFTRKTYSKFDLKVNTTCLKKNTIDRKKNSNSLANQRTEIQQNIIKNYDNNNPISVINAPTGTGKTKAFLDIIAKYGKNYSRIFYFSPLLALTDDIESKISECIKDQRNEILKYTSIHVETLDNKSKNDEKWDFDYESFNKKFIITTVQRLLMTIYSPRQKDKLKLASFRNSLLILDEVQTISKEILTSLVSQLYLLNKYLGTKIILISATIPYELTRIPKVVIPQKILDDYLKNSKKHISFAPKLDISEIKDKKFLLMLNTRRKTKDAWDTLHDKNTTYITAGITKKHKQERIQNIKNIDKVIATQSIEAGVDISFTRIYREMAPLDSIVQVLGRLNRENYESDALLTVFETDGQHIPYTKLEYQTSKKYISDFKEQDVSYLYEKLGKYYKEIHDNNMNDNTKELLSSNTKNMNFKRVWEIIGRTMNDRYANVFIPEQNEWSSIKEKLLRNKHHQVNETSAKLPISHHSIIEYFDEDMLEKNILLVKKDMINEIYDADIGLDKWTTKK